jgi:CBS domain-containing protein
MAKNIISVKRDTPVYEAIELLAENDITGMPVVEDDMTLLGVISEKDVLRLFYADEEEKNKPVEFFMTRPAACYDENDSLQKICDFMRL